MCHDMAGTSLSMTFAAFTMGNMELAELAQSANVRNLVQARLASMCVETIPPTEQVLVP